MGIRDKKTFRQFLWIGRTVGSKWSGEVLFGSSGNLSLGMRFVILQT